MHDSALKSEPTIPMPLQTAGAWSWRIIAIVVVLTGIAWVGLQISQILISLFIALLIAVVIEPMTSWLRKRAHFPSAAAAATGVLGLVLFVGLLIWGSGLGIVAGFWELSDQFNAGINSIVEWVTINFPDAGSQLDDAWATLQATLAKNTMQIFGGVVTVGSSLTSFLTGFVITLFSLFFFLKDGRRLWQWFVRLFPAHKQTKANEAGIRMWMTIGNYTRTQAIVALVDAIGIVIIAVLLKTPLLLAFPIGVIVFLAAFIPIVGAFLSGFIAVIVVLVNTQSWVMALLMLFGIVLVQQIEGNLLQPVLQGNALNMHPLAIVLVVTAGAGVAGIVGALFMVPIVAAINVAVLYLRGHDLYPYLDTMEDRPGGPPREFAEFREAYWENFNKNIAQHEPPKIARANKKANRRNKRNAQANTGETEE